MVVVELALGVDPASDPAGWSWTDISQYVRTDIRITRGKTSPLATTVPASCTMIINNQAGRFVPRNPTGPYYGQLRRNTPIRVRVDPGSGWSTRFTGNVPAWPPRRDISGRDEWVPLTATGALAQLSHAGRDQRSALTRYIQGTAWSTPPLGYWPLEDQSDAQSGAGTPAPMMVDSGAVRWGATAPLSGVSSLVDTSGGSLVAWLPSTTSATWRVECVVAYSAVPTTDVTILSWRTPGPDLHLWRLQCTSTGFRLLVYSQPTPAAPTLELTLTSTQLPTPGELHHLRVQANPQLSIDTEVALLVDGVQVAADTITSALAASPAPRIRINEGAADSDMPLVGQVLVQSGSPASDTPSAAAGWAGATVGDRMTDLSATEGVPLEAIGSAAATERIGPQPVGSYLTVMRALEATDGGVLHEALDGPLRYVPRVDLYRRDPALALDYAAREIQPPLEPTEDDAQLLNRVTASRPGGSEYTYEVTSSVAAEGEYADAISVNPRWDARLTNLAAWPAQRGAITEQRLDTLAISLTRTPGLIPDWLATDIGDRVVVDNIPSALQPDPVDVILVGYTETIQHPRVWRVDMICEPAKIYNEAGVRDDDVSRRDTAGSELDAPVDADDTTLSVATLTGPLWTQAGAHLPFDLNVGGERITVTAVSGSTSPQTMTVVRSVNGVIKSHAAGAPVRLWAPARRAL